MNLNMSSNRALPAQQPEIRVLLADDHAVTLWGLSQLVDSARPRMKVVGTATSCAELLSHRALADTDVVLLDLGLRDANAIDCVRELVDLGVQVVLLTGDLDPSHPAEHLLAVHLAHVAGVGGDLTYAVRGDRLAAAGGGNVAQVLSEGAQRQVGNNQEGASGDH